MMVNKTIQELAEKAGFDLPQVSDKKNNALLEKFAELVAEKCALEAWRGIDPDGIRAAGLLARYKIMLGKKHEIGPKI